jgi:transposase
MNLHLEEISKRYPEQHIVLVLDNAAWHKSQELVVPENMTLLPLPPYSPELNPVEQLWKAMRRQWFGNKLFDTMDALENELVQALRWIENTPEWVQTFAGYSWIVSAI